jgi:exopolysaccharide production protein ExoZ
MPRSPRAGQRPGLRSRLRSSPRSGARVKLGSLELGRFLAASLVVVSHVLSALPRHTLAGRPAILGGWVAPGSFGVEYFFLLSGFVMLLAHHRDFGQLAAVPRFWWRRACRIYPVFWLALIIPCLMSSAHWGTGQALGILSLVSAHVDDYLPPAWSLRYELAFYLMFGLFLLPVVGRYLLCLWVALVVWRQLPVPWERLTTPGFTHGLRHVLVHQADIFTSTFNALFMAGLLAAWLYLRLPASRLAGLMLVATGCGVLLADGPALHWYQIYATGAGLLPLGGGFAALMLGLATLERTGTLRLPAWVFGLGDISYPLYLLHVPLIFLMDRGFGGRLHLPPAGLYALVVMGLVVIFLVAALVTRLFDQPLQRGLRRVGGGGR